MDDINIKCCKSHHKKLKWVAIIDLKESFYGTQLLLLVYKMKSYTFTFLFIKALILFPWFLNVVITN